MAGTRSTPFGELLHHARQAAGLTQQELAKQAGLSSRGISALERGARRAPRRETVQLLVQALNLADEERSAFEAAAQRSTELSSSVLTTDPALSAVSNESIAPSLPTGTITFLFTDMEGSTRLLQQLGGAGYAALHAAHHKLLRAACRAHGGREVNTAGDSFFLKCCQWYGTLAGLFWPCIPVCATLFAACPPTIGLQLFSGPPFGNANVKDITPRDLRRIRLELLLTLVVFTVLLWLFQWRWLNLLVLYGCFSVNWSTRQYVGHAFSKRDIVEGAWNLRHNWLMSKVLLHGEWDLTHHRHPEVSWYYLPTVASPDEPRLGYVKQYWRQWLGPRLATEPTPQLPGLNLSRRMTPEEGG